MNYIDQAVTGYMERLASVDDEPVLLEMEEMARARSFPIVGRLCGETLEVLARSVGARRIFEMGSGYGYSAYWFSRAVGPQGEIHLTDTDPENEHLAAGFLARAGLDGPIRYHVSDAFEAFDATEGEFDIVYCDIDKQSYPDAWARARSRIRIGGLYICDNMLWSGRVAGEESGMDAATAAIHATNQAIFRDPGYRATIVPTRDGVMVAVRVA